MKWFSQLVFPKRGHKARLWFFCCTCCNTQGRCSFYRRRSLSGNRRAGPACDDSGLKRSTEPLSRSDLGFRVQFKPCLARRSFHGRGSTCGHQFGVCVCDTTRGAKRGLAGPEGELDSAAPGWSRKTGFSGIVPGGWYPRRNRFSALWIFMPESLRIQDRLSRPVF